MKQHFIFFTFFATSYGCSSIIKKEDTSAPETVSHEQDSKTRIPASATMEEAEYYISSLKSTQIMKGHKGCENVKISRSDDTPEINYFLQIGSGKTVQLLNPYTLSSTQVNDDSYKLS